jgi:hypothetical protein
VPRYEGICSIQHADPVPSSADSAHFDQRVFNLERPAFRDGVSVLALMMASKAFIANA